MSTFYDQDWNVDHDKTTGCEGGRLGGWFTPPQKPGFCSGFTIPETKIQPLKIVYLKGHFIFQPLIFRANISFRQGTTPAFMLQLPYF